MRLPIVVQPLMPHFQECAGIKNHVEEVFFLFRVWHVTHVRGSYSPRVNFLSRFFFVATSEQDPDDGRLHVSLRDSYPSVGAQGDGALAAVRVRKILAGRHPAALVSPAE